MIKVSWTLSFNRETKNWKTGRTSTIFLLTKEPEWKKRLFNQLLKLCVSKTRSTSGRNIATRFNNNLLIKTRKCTNYKTRLPIMNPRSTCSLSTTRDWTNWFNSRMKKPRRSRELPDKAMSITVPSNLSKTKTSNWSKNSTIRKLWSSKWLKESEILKAMARRPLKNWLKRFFC